MSEEWSISNEEALGHDFKLIDTTFDRIQAAGAQGTMWHNAAVQLASEGAVEAIKLASLDALKAGATASEAVDDVISNMLQIMFYIGYEIGEGSEHIQQCHCTNPSPN